MGSEGQPEWVGETEAELYSAFGSSGEKQSKLTGLEQMAGAREGAGREEA